MGLVFGVVAGSIAGWGFAELTRESPRRLALGVTYGFVLWLGAVPVTLADAWFRSIGFTQARRGWADTISFVLAIAGGAVLGVLRGASRRAIVAGAAAVLAITMAMGGPVPVGRSVRALEILFAVLAACVIGGVTVAYLEPRLRQS